MSFKNSKTLMTFTNLVNNFTMKILSIDYDSNYNDENNDNRNNLSRIVKAYRIEIWILFCRKVDKI